ncbi:MAG: Ig-like domain-containing protein [Clostridia bacterium]|nr:Ig-like domain-containing protein [Clostridia bacterium]
MKKASLKRCFSFLLSITVFLTFLFVPISFVHAQTSLVNVSVTSDGTNLCVKFTLTDNSWSMTQTNVAAGTITRNKTHNPSINDSYTEVINFSDAGLTKGQTVSVQASAVVQKPGDGQSEDKAITIVSDTGTQVMDDCGNWVSSSEAWISDSWCLIPKIFDNAKMIWKSFNVSEPLNGEIAEFRREFNIDGDPVSMQIDITCDNGYEVRINGNTIGSAQVRGDWKNSGLTKEFVDHNGWEIPEVYTVSGSLLKVGANILEITGVDEYMGYLDGEEDGTVETNPAGLIYKAVVNYKKSSSGEGTRETLNYSMDYTIPAENPENRAPVASNDSYSVNKNGVLTISAPGILLNDSDPDGDSITATRLSDPANGTLALNTDGSFIYTPQKGFTGSDYFTYRVWDTHESSSEAATVTISVNKNTDNSEESGDNTGNGQYQSNTTPANKPPTAANDSYTTDQDEVLKVEVPGVLSNDSDPEGSILVAVKETDPISGTVIINKDGSFEYIPKDGFFGDDSFKYHVTDTSGNSSGTATVTVAIREKAAVMQVLQDETPTAVDDLYSISEDEVLKEKDPGVLSNDSNPEGGAVMAINDSEPQNGTLAFYRDGSFEYTPNTGFSGIDTFMYHIIDKNGNVSNSAKVTIDVVARIIEIEDEPVPLDPVEGKGSLPKTGGVPAEIFYGLGTAIIGIGVFIRKKSRM